MGRPRGPDRPHRFEVRLTDDEHASLERLVERQGLPAGEVLRGLLARAAARDGAGVLAAGAARATVIAGDCLEVLPTLPARTFRTCVTSPAYWGLRDFRHDRQIGMEETVDDYVENLVSVFREVRRVLRDDGTLWLNLGEVYTAGGRTWRAKDRKSAHRAMHRRPQDPPGMKPKDLVGLPWMVAAALRQDGWYLRADVILSKTAFMPAAVKDRPWLTHEHLFLLSKSADYWYSPDARTTRETRTSVWTLPPSRSVSGHPAVMTAELPRRCIMAATEAGDSVLDPFAGVGTVGKVAVSLGRNATLIELNRGYAKLARGG